MASLNLDAGTILRKGETVKVGEQRLEVCQDEGTHSALALFYKK